LASVVADSVVAALLPASEVVVSVLLFCAQEAIKATARLSTISFFMLILFLKLKFDCTRLAQAVLGFYASSHIQNKMVKTNINQALLR
jgi:hypothetical protein